MNFTKDELNLIKLLSQGYVIPVMKYNENEINKILNGTFVLNKKNIKIVKNHSFTLNYILSATIDTRFNLSINDNLQSI